MVEIIIEERRIMLESHVEHMETEGAMPKGQDKFQHHKSIQVG